METVGSSQVDERPASFRRFRVVDVDKEGRSFRLLAVKKGLKNPSLRSLINKIVETHLDFGSSVRSELDKVAREWGSKEGRRDKSMLSIDRL